MIVSSKSRDRKPMNQGRNETDMIEAAAAFIRQVRATGRQINRLPATVAPTTLEDAYAIQAAVVAADGRDIVGFKLGGTTAGTRAAFATDNAYFGCLGSLR